MTSKTIESQDYGGRRKIIGQGMLKLAITLSLILLIISTSLSTFLVIKHVTKNHDNPAKETNADHHARMTQSPKKFSKIETTNAKMTMIPNAEHSTLPTTTTLEYILQRSYLNP